MYIPMFNSVLLGGLTGLVYGGLWVWHLQKFGTIKSSALDLDSAKNLKLDLEAASRIRLFFAVLAIILSTLLFKINIIMFAGGLMVALIPVVILKMWAF